MKNPETKYKNFNEVLVHLKSMEVTLNQLLNIFFSFLPANLLHQFFEKSVNTPIRLDEYELFIRNLTDIIATDDIGNITQPDFFFAWHKNNIAVEMKIWAKSSLDQVMKYALLQQLEYEKSWIEKKYYLIYIWKGAFAQQRQEKFETVYELKKAFRNHEIPNTSKNWKLDYSPYKDKIHEMMDKMIIGYINYDDMKQFCEEALPLVEQNKQVKKLLMGLIDELTERNLTTT